MFFNNKNNNNDDNNNNNNTSDLYSAFQSSVDKGTGGCSIIYSTGIRLAGVNWSVH